MGGGSQIPIVYFHSRQHLLARCQCPLSKFPPTLPPLSFPELYENKRNKGLVLIFVLAHDQAKDGRVCAQLKEIKEKISIVRYSKRGIYPCCLLLIADRVFQNPARLPT